MHNRASCFLFPTVFESLLDWNRWLLKSWWDRCILRRMLEVTSAVYLHCEIHATLRDVSNIGEHQASSITARWGDSLISIRHGYCRSIRNVLISELAFSSKAKQFHTFIQLVSSHFDSFLGGRASILSAFAPDVRIFNPGIGLNAPASLQRRAQP